MLTAILDNGHGYNTAGKRSPVWADGKQLLEWEFNRAIVKKVANKLHEDNISYVILVPEDYDVSLSERVRRANAITNGFVVSIHANAGGGTGFEVWTSKGQTRSDAMAEICFDEAQKEFGSQWRMRYDTTDGDHDKESQFTILAKTKCPAFLVECFFMDNERDCRFIMSEEGRDRIANMIVRTIKRIMGG